MKLVIASLIAAAAISSMLAGCTSSRETDYWGRVAVTYKEAVR